MKFKQLFLFEEDVGDPNDDAPTDSSTPSASRGPPRGKHVPHYTYAIAQKSACISIQTGPHIEDFPLHTQNLLPAEFEESVRGLCKQLLGIFREDEIFLRRITALRYEREHTLRVAPYEPPGSFLHKRALKIAQEYKPPC